RSERNRGTRALGDGAGYSKADIEKMAKQIRYDLSVARTRIDELMTAVASLPLPAESAKTKWRRAIRPKKTRPLPAADQRQSRTLHPHPARGLGLRLQLSARTRPSPRSGTSTLLIQSLPQTPRSRRARTLQRVNNLSGTNN